MTLSSITNCLLYPDIMKTFVSDRFMDGSAKNFPGVPIDKTYVIRHMIRQIQSVNVAHQELQFPEFPLCIALGWGEPQKMFHTRFGRQKEQQYSVYAQVGTKCDCIPGKLLSIC